MATAPKKAPDFASIMDMPIGEIKPPKPVPAGDYLAMVVGHAEPGEATTGTPFVTITFQLLEPIEKTVDEDDLQEALTRQDGTIMPLREKTVQTRLYLTDKTAYRNALFFKNLGIADTVPFSEAIESVAGCQTIITLKHELSRSSEGVFAQITGNTKVK